MKDFPEPVALDRQTGDSFAALIRVMQRLLAPDGCPWDREQTPESLRRYVLEEACEVIDAIDSGDPRLVQEELGDLALQIAFLSELFRARQAFGPDDVMRSICDKLIRRHPHVFADERAESSADVEVHWERIKAEEKRARPLLDGVPRSLPALLRAERSGRLAARVGFDWSSAEGAHAKVLEEWQELERELAAGDEQRVAEEFGDLLFALVNWGRHLGLEPEACLRAACDKFRDRFDFVEREVRREQGDWPRDERGKPMRGVAEERLEQWWEEAKRNESR